MTEPVFKNILDCRSLEQQSVNKTYKIAAKLHLFGQDGSVISYSRPNIKLDILKEALDEKGTIGGASDTIHAETAVIMGAPVTNHGTLYVTDPICPNCMKNAIEAGIENIYIDSAGFQKPWYKKRLAYFDHISLKLAELAGVQVRSADPDNCIIKDLVHISSGPTIANDPVQIEPLPKKSRMEPLVKRIKEQYKNKSFAFGIGRDETGQQVLIQACEAYTPGLDDEMRHVLDEIQSYNKQNKYRLKSDPVTRLMMAASKHGISLRGSHVYCSHLPTARCQVNAVGYGIEDIRVGNIEDNTNSNDLDAAVVLSRHGILNFEFEDDDKSTL